MPKSVARTFGFHALRSDSTSNNRWRGRGACGLAPRALRDCAPSASLGASLRPLNFTVRSLMGISWGQLTFEPDEETLATFRSSWSWLLREPYTPLLFSTLGDVFLESEGGAVYWLNTGVGSLCQIADSAQ